MDLENRVLLMDCEVVCLSITGEMIACPLSKEEQDVCPQRKEYLEKKENYAISKTN